MKEEWWERPICFLCDRWWMLLLAIVLALAAYFTRGYWLPLAGITLPTPTPISATPVPTITPASASFALTPSVTEIATPETFYGYVNRQGGYAFNYPSDWTGTETGTNVRFELYNGSNAQVTVSNVSPNQALDTSVADFGPMPAPPTTQSTTTLAGETAIRREILDERNGQVVSLIYSVLHGTRLYNLSLYAPAENALPPDFSQSLSAFERMVQSFYFLEPNAP